MFEKTIKIGFAFFHEFIHPRRESPNPVSDVVSKWWNKIEGMASKPYVERPCPNQTEFHTRLKMIKLCSLC